MSGDPAVHVEREGPVAVLVMDHQPTMNGLSPRMRDLLIDRFSVVEADVDVGAIVIAGAHRAFSAGSDLTAILDQDLDERVERLAAFHAFLASWADLAKPVMVAVDGAAAGGGVSLVLNADYAVASTDAHFVSAWTALGVAPDAGAAWWLHRTMGPKHAWDWLHGDRRLTAAEAREAGIIADTCEPGTARAVAVQRATDVLRLPAGARAATKRLLRRSAEASSLESFLTTELYVQAHLFASAEHRDAVTAFIDRMRRRRPS